MLSLVLVLFGVWFVLSVVEEIRDASNGNTVRDRARWLFFDGGLDVALKRRQWIFWVAWIILIVSLPLEL